GFERVDSPELALATVVAYEPGVVRRGDRGRIRHVDGRETGCERPLRWGAQAVDGLLRPEHRLRDTQVGFAARVPKDQGQLIIEAVQQIRFWPPRTPPGRIRNGVLIQ